MPSTPASPVAGSPRILAWNGQRISAVDTHCNCYRVHTDDQHCFPGFCRTQDSRNALSVFPGAIFARKQFFAKCPQYLITEKTFVATQVPVNVLKLNKHYTLSLAKLNDFSAWPDVNNNHLFPRNCQQLLCLKRLDVKKYSLTVSRCETCADL